VKLRECTKEEFDSFVKMYPKELSRRKHGMFEPPLITYDDWQYGKWPDSTVARIVCNEEMGTDPITNKTEPDSYAIMDGGSVKEEK